jgi:hypothetical protein
MYRHDGKCAAPQRRTFDVELLVLVGAKDLGEVLGYDAAERRIRVGHREVAALAVAHLQAPFHFLAGSVQQSRRLL